MYGCDIHQHVTTVIDRPAFNSTDAGNVGKTIATAGELIQMKVLQESWLRADHDHHDHHRRPNSTRSNLHAEQQCSGTGTLAWGADDTTPGRRGQPPWPRIRQLSSCQREHADRKRAVHLIPPHCNNAYFRPDGGAWVPEHDCGHRIQFQLHERATSGLLRQSDISEIIRRSRRGHSLRYVCTDFRCIHLGFGAAANVLPDHIFRGCL